MSTAPVNRAAVVTTNALLAIVCALSAVAAYSTYAADRGARVPVQKFADEFKLPLRRPDIVESLQYAPSADFADDLVADATLRDVLVPVRLSGLEPPVRAAWIDAVGHYDEQMSRASDIELDALSARPGWPYHASLLGQIVYHRRLRALSPELVTIPAQWVTPMLTAAQAAPVDEALWQSLGVAYLQTWPELKSTHARTFAEVFRNAFADVSFVRLALGPALEIAGKDAVLPALPSVPPALWEAFRQLHSSGDVESAWQLHGRWDSAEWAARQLDLQGIERAAGRGDVARTRQLCAKWAAAHPVWQYDSPAAHTQAVRLLELWPAGGAGSWTSDPRANVVRYVLSRKMPVVTAGALEAANEIDRVPEPVHAECELVAGDFESSWRRATAASDFGASNDWTPYLFVAVRHLTGIGRQREAKEAFSRLPATLRNGCAGEAMRRLIEKDSVPGSATFPEQVLTLDAPLAICATDGGSATFILPSIDKSLVADILYDGARGSSTLLQPGVTQRVAVAMQRGSHTIVVRSAAR